MRILILALGALALAACKHPLSIQGEGDIVERLSGDRGCTLEEFQAKSTRCMENEVSDEDYFVQYEAIPRPGWRFAGWEGSGCDPTSSSTFCEFNIARVWVDFTDDNWPGIAFPATLAVFKPISEGYTFTKIVDTDRTAPGGSGKFASFGLPALGNGALAFDTNNPVGNYWAVLTYTAEGLNLVADTNGTVPGSLDKFERVFAPEISQDKVVFGGLAFGEGAGLQHWGLYSDLDSGVRTVADLDTIIPGGIGNFTDDLAIEDSFRIHNGTVAFDSYSGAGVYAEVDGDLVAVANLSTPVPGGGNFNEVYLAGIDGDDIVFYGSSSSGGAITHAFYRNSNGQISKLFNTNALRTGQFFDFVSDTHSYIELNEDFSQRSLYLSVGSIAQLVAEIGDSAPGGGSFTSFENLAVSGKELAFAAGVDDVDVNIYKYAYGELHKVISVGDSLDGKTVVDLNMKNASGLENGVLAFRAIFDDGSSGIYLAE